MNLDQLKHSSKGKLKFRLSDALIYTSESGFTYSKYLDLPKTNSPSDDSYAKLTKEQLKKQKEYIEANLESNKQRFQNQINVVNEFANCGNLLDVGCGGGAFISIAQDNNFMCQGIELNVNRANFAKNKTGALIHQEDICSDEFISKYSENFDVISMWDVIEHVNYPCLTIESISKCNKKGGWLFIDTPAKDSFYHRFGELTYKLSGGRLPTFLNLMYSDTPFGHKQIFSTGELKKIVEESGYEIKLIKKFHELSFPYKHYLKKISKNKYFLNIFDFLLKFVFKFLRIQNKFVLVAQKIV